MTAVELLESLRDAMLVLELTPGGGLRYEALARDLTDAEVALLREHRDALVLHLRAEAQERSRHLAATTVPPWRFNAVAAADVVAKGWSQPGPLAWCVTCGAPTVWADDAGRPRHPWCAARPGRAA